MNRRLILLILLAAVAVAALYSRRQMADLDRAEAICEATGGGDWEEVLRLADSFPSRLSARQRAAECVCVAELETGDRATCSARLTALRDEDPTWFPAPPLVAVMVEELRDRGALEPAAALAREGASHYPDEFILAYLELDLRSRIEGETGALEELTARVLEGRSASLLLRLFLAETFIERSEWSQSLELLGSTPPEDPTQVERWHQARTMALAADGRQRELREAAQAWRQSGGDGAEIDARYAVLLSSFNLRDPRLSTQEWLLKALERVDEIENRELAGTLYARTVRILSANGKEELARELHQRARPEFGDLSGLTVEAMERSVLSKEARATSTLSFAVQGAEAGDRILVSPPPEVPVDSPYESLSIGAGRATIDRRPAVTPQRWVLLDAEGSVRGSGSVWPAAVGTVEVVIERREAARAAPDFVPSKRPVDGRRRVLLVVLDSGDWRLVQYLRTRGELPVLDSFAREGLSGVLDSNPAFTAAAMQALVHPIRRGPGSLIGALHQFGREVETMNFVGRNPVGWLEWLLPSVADLFETIGAGELVAANLLRSFGALDFGRHARLTGPFGEERTISGYSGRRPFTSEDGLREPDLARWIEIDAATRPKLEEMGADFDTIHRLVEEGEADFVALRVDSMDLATHGYYSAIATTRQDDGDSFLLALYRYADRRLGELRSAMDGDDVLIVISDHGTETALEHDRNSLYFISGDDVPRGRLDGRPALRGVARLVAELLRVETEWPSTGLESWVDQAATSSGESSIVSIDTLSDAS